MFNVQRLSRLQLLGFNKRPVTRVLLPEPMTARSSDLRKGTSIKGIHTLWKLSASHPPAQISSKLHQEQWRGYAKSKDKGKGTKPGKVHLTDGELEQVISVQKYKEELEKIFENLKEEYIKSLSIRTSLGALESIPVELDGEKYPLGEIAQVIRKNPSLVIINAVDFPQASANIRKAIEESGMNLNPQQDGTTISVPIPKVTKEHREGLAHNAKTLCDKSKVEVRELQNKYIKKVKNKDGQVSDDLLHQTQLKVREMATEASAKLESMMKTKQGELLKVSK